MVLVALLLRASGSPRPPLRGEPSSPSPSNAPATRGARSESRFPAAFDTLGLTMGAADAPVVVREFGDFQCPPCAGFTPVLARLREEYVAKGLVRFVFFDFPISDRHPNALGAARAARCAARQGAWWPMHDLLFARQDDWSAEPDPAPLFREYASEVGIDGDAVSDCVAARETALEVQRTLTFALALGIRSAPTILVGDTIRPGTVTWEELEALVQQHLRGARGDPPP